MIGAAEPLAGTEIPVGHERPGARIRAWTRPKRQRPFARLKISAGTIGPLLF